jgi:2-C-methyl-D-erythritol 4-phosphate cytidylyltransferase
MGFPNHAVVITAAGSSDRFNNNETNVKKEYLSINGHTVLWGATAPFLEVPGCKAILVTHPAGMAGECGLALEDLLEQNMVPIILVEGGTTRQSSVYNALSMLSKLGLDIDYVAIHDGARCFIESELIIRTLATATVFGSAVPALPTVDTVKVIDDNGVITHHIDRTHAVGVQTPQIFRYPAIWEAHQEAKAKGTSYTDDTQVFTDYGQVVGICEGQRSNRKITFLSDIPDAEEQIAAYQKNLKEAEKAAEATKLFKQSVAEYQRESHP